MFSTKRILNNGIIYPHRKGNSFEQVVLILIHSPLSAMQTRIMSWYEIPAFDFDKAIHFYAKALALKIERRVFGTMHYGVIQDGADGIPGAIVKSEASPTEKEREGPVLFFKVYDMSDTLERIRELGGVVVKEKSLIRNQLENGTSVIPKTLIDNSLGYYALFRDPEGNKMALYSNS
jgi:predicted enzyme related to lactoylglutathione lyase